MLHQNSLDLMTITSNITSDKGRKSFQFSFAYAWRIPSNSGDKITHQSFLFFLQWKAYHLRIFSSAAYVKIQEETRTKLENQSQKCVLLGRGGTSCGLKVYNPIAKTVATSRDVQLDGEQPWKWSSEG